METIREYVIQKENAVFWLDKDGRWRNEGGRFRHKRIIDHFHQSISKDSGGYFVSQQKGDILEKVYFRYEDTALFVFDVLINSDVTLVLNTRKQMKLNPRQLHLHNDNLYVIDDNEKIKFAEYALIKISELIEEKDHQLLIILKGTSYRISED